MSRSNDDLNQDGLDLSPEFRGRVAKLVAMLASEADGEVLNAARLLGQSLAAQGLTINDLAKSIADGHVASPRFRLITELLLTDMVREAVAGLWALREDERLFVRDYESRFSQDVSLIAPEDFQRLEDICREIRLRTGRRH